MVFSIDGVDILPYIAYGGLKWQRSDVDGPNAGRNLEGEMIRDRVAVKIRWDVTCRPLLSSELARILKLIEPEFVTVTYLNPVINEIEIGKFYANNFPGSFLMTTKNGLEYWNGLSFPLIMK